MNEQEIRAKIAAYDKSAADTEAGHYHFDLLVTEVLKYIASGGRNPGAVAEELLRHESPTKWGWYA